MGISFKEAQTQALGIHSVAVLDLNVFIQFSLSISPYSVLALLTWLQNDRNENGISGRK
jgi:hypothetical protein